MFEKYNDKARRAIFFARYEASQSGSSAIGCEHLLLALLREDPALLERFLQGSKISITEIRKRIEQALSQSETLPTLVDLPLSPGAKQALIHALDESVRLEDGYVGTEHLLLGLLREEKSAAYSILRELGLDIGLARERMRQRGRIPIEEESAEERCKRLIDELRELARSMLKKADELEEMLDERSSGGNEIDRAE